MVILKSAFLFFADWRVPRLPHGDDVRVKISSNSRSILAGILFVVSTAAAAQAPSPNNSAAPPQPAQDTRPLPDIPALLLAVQKNQSAIEDLRKDYTCHLFEEQDRTDSNGNVKSRELKDYDVFYVGDEQVLHLLAKDGKPLEEGEKQQEEDRFNKKYDDLKKKQAELAADPKSAPRKNNSTRRSFPISCARKPSRIRAAKCCAARK
jgi:hypothetical protein